MHVIKHDRDWCPCCRGLCGKSKIRIQKLSKYKHNDCFDSATTVFHLLFLANFNQVHEVMNLCFEKNVEKQCGASYIRRQLEEAWSTEGIWDTYLWIRLPGNITFGLLKTIPAVMFFIMLCRIVSLVTLHFKANTVSTSGASLNYKTFKNSWLAREVIIF